MNNQTKERFGYTSNILSSYIQGTISGIKKLNLFLPKNNNSNNNRNGTPNNKLAQAIIVNP